MEQLIQPNYNQTVKAGLCHKYSRLVFGIGRLYDPSWQNWLNLKYKHEDRNFPNASVPVWFEWWGKLPGDKEKKLYGHTAVRDKSGTVYSSPLSGEGNAWFNSVDDLIKAFGNGMKYVGWSEDINNVRVVQETTMTIKDREQAKALYTAILHRNADKVSNAEADGLIGKDIFDIINKWLPSPEWQNVNGMLYSLYPEAQKKIKDLEGQVGKTVDSEAVKKLQKLKEALMDALK